MTLLIAIVLYLAFFSMGVPDGMIGAAWPLIHLDVQVPISYAGGVTFLISAGTVISAFSANALITRLGSWCVTVYSTLLTALALIGFALAPNFALLCGCALPLGLGAGAIDAVLNNYVALNGTSRQMSWVHVAWGVGATCGPLLLALNLTHSLTWRSGYWSVAVVQLLMTTLLFLSKPLWKRDAHSPASTQSPVSTRKALHLKGLPFALLGLFAMQGLEFCSGIWSASYLHVIGKLTAESSAQMAMLVYGGMTAGRFLSGFIANRLGDKLMIRFGTICAGGGILLLIRTSDVSLMVAALFLLGLGIAPLFPCFLHATPTHFGERYTQAVMGLQMAAAYIGGSLMPPLIGGISEFVSLAVYPYFLLTFLIVMILSLERLNHLHPSA